MPAVALAAPEGPAPDPSPRRTGLSGASQTKRVPLLYHGQRVYREIRAAARRFRVARRARLRREREEAFAALPGGVSMSTLESIASCESGGNPAAVSSDGSYRGKYQFSFSTWASVGGSGDPAAAPEAEQDYRAALLYSRAGSSPWPICGS